METQQDKHHLADLNERVPTWSNRQRISKTLIIPRSIDSGNDLRHWEAVRRCHPHELTSVEFDSYMTLIALTWKLDLGS